MTDARREDFKRYVTETGIVDSLNRVLAALYDEPQRPAEPLEYIKNHLGYPKNVDYNALRAQNNSLKAQIAQIDAQIAQLKGK